MCVNFLGGDFEMGAFLRMVILDIMGVKDFVAGDGAMIYFSIERKTVPRKRGGASGSCCNLLNFSASFTCSSFSLFFSQNSVCILISLLSFCRCNWPGS